MPIDARVEAARLLKLYEEDPTQQSFTALILGLKGTGKTNLLKTARKPVHIDSFDPGGTKTLRVEIKKGNIVPDTIYESENPLQPRAFDLWRRNLATRLNSDYFSHFGTYCLDSSTTWAQAIMNFVTASAKNKDGTTRAGQVPNYYRDYRPQMQYISNSLRLLLSLPCDFILTGHLKEKYEKHYIRTEDGELEEESELVGYEYMTSGDGKVIIPLLFSEQWITLARATGSTTKYTLLTQRQGLFVATSRLSESGALKQEEEPDIQAILKKCGLPWQNKPKLSTLTTEG